MKYMGSKSRHAKEILNIILKNRTNNQWYVEPFVGGANVIDKVTGPRLGADINPYLIQMLDKASEGWLPPEHITEKEYIEIKNNKDEYPPELVGYCGFALSYGGKWFGGWRRDSQNKRNYVKEARSNALKQFPKLSGAVFKCSSYDNLEIPPQSIIYCDPPYKGTTKYINKFDHEKFYRWCNELDNLGHEVFISEYDMPEGFTCIWEKSVASSLTKDTGARRNIEKLFKVKK